jgi:hypothetical protein
VVRHPDPPLHTRLAAGWSQAQLARKAGYARSTISTAESRGLGTTREFWERCDHALGTGLSLTNRYDQLALPAVTLAPATTSAALALTGLVALGWPVTSRNGRPTLECGSHVDALQVFRPAGILAAAWWRGTAGAADPARALPALPSPAAALIVIQDQDCWYFLTAPGSYPFPITPTPSRAADGGPVIRWHGPGSRIALPPAGDPEGPLAAWAFPVPTRPRLADPVALLALLGPAAAMTRDAASCLQLPGGVRVTPAAPAGTAA